MQYLTSHFQSLFSRGILRFLLIHSLEGSHHTVRFSYVDNIHSKSLPLRP
jgi:hypothetical protein